MKVTATELKEVKLREAAKLYAALVTTLLEDVAGEEASHLHRYLDTIREQDATGDLVVKLCNFVDHIGETLVMADLLSSEERIRFEVWAASVARLGEKSPLPNIVMPFAEPTETREIRIDLPEVEVIAEE